MEGWTHKLFFSTDMIIRKQVWKKREINFAPNIKLMQNVLQMQVATKGKIREKQSKARMVPSVQ